MSTTTTTYYYGYRTVDPITKVPPYDACIYKGVVFYRGVVTDKSGLKEIRIYESWRTFSSPSAAINDALNWVNSTPDWHFAIGPVPETPELAMVVS